MQVRSQRIYRFDEFQLDVLERHLLRHGQPVPLKGKSFELLLVLVEHSGQVLEKEELYQLVWPDQVVEESNLTVHMSAVRKALGERASRPHYITTVSGLGYRFVADLHEPEDETNELVVERHTVARIVIEGEEFPTDEPQQPPATSENKGRTIGGREVDWLAPGKSEAARKTRLKYAVVAGSLICLASALGIYYLNGKHSAEPFEKIKLTRLTNSGRVSGANISPDGKYIAYVLGESEGNSLWVQQVGTASNVRLLPPVKAQVYELTFTPDGSHIFYSLFTYGNTDLEFYRISSLGGVTEKIPNVIATYIAFAPDGKRLAYVQSDSPAGQNYLVIADADGGNQQTIARKTQPNTFESNAQVVTWSPDGETIACLVNHFEADASYSSIIGINAHDGSEKLLSQQRWYEVFSIEWLKNGSGLLVSASDKVSGSNQIRLLSYPQGEARQITNDLSQYDSLSATADGKSLVTIQTNTTSGIFVGEAGADEFKEIISETGALQPFVWTPDGRIIYRSNKDGVSNLWTMDADGGNRRQLTANAQVDSRGLCISPDGKYLVFGSWRNGKSNLWRVDADGGNLTQLTNGEVDVYPSCSPDNRTIIYQKGLHTRQMLWKVPLAGGEPVQLTASNSKWPAISSDGSRISYFFMADDKWRFGIISPEGGSMLQRLDVPGTLKGYSTHWSLDNQSIFYISTVGNVGNIWSLPLDGSTAKPLTTFTSQLLSDFSLSPDGKHFAVSRMSSTSDAVLISNAR